MDAELIMMRRNRKLGVQADDNITRLDSDSLFDRIYTLNTNMTRLVNISRNDNSVVEDYIKPLIDNIYTILSIFDEMGVYPDYFYDIYFRANEKYQDLARAGKVNNRDDWNNSPEFRAEISYLMEKGINSGNYRFNPTKVRNIGEYYNEMVEFLHRFNLPHEVLTSEMCREMVANISNECNNSINSFGMRPYVSDDIESLSRLLFEYIKFFAAIGKNPNAYLDKRIDEEYELGKSK